MRQFLVLMMIVLLPLRGWAGDLMGLQMATHQGSHAEAAVTPHAMPSDCLMHKANPATPADDPVPAAPDHGGCSSCQLCLPLAASPAVHLHIVSFARHAKPAMGDTGFASALPSLALKPPIS